MREIMVHALGSERVHASQYEEQVADSKELFEAVERTRSKIHIIETTRFREHSLTQTIPLRMSHDDSFENVACWDWGCGHWHFG